MIYFYPINDLSIVNSNLDNKIESYVGMIIYSSTLDTEAKVKAIYGGTSWTKIEGRFLLGTSLTYAVNSTGGEATHKLTTSEIPSHTHVSVNDGRAVAMSNSTGDATGVAASGTAVYWQTSNLSQKSTGSTGGGSAHNNMPPYKAVYIWERKS